MTENGRSFVSTEGPADGHELARLRAELADARARLEAAEEARRSARDREALLLGELQHRLRNTLATVRSVFARTVASGGLLEDVDAHFRGRLDVLARYQQGRAIDPSRNIDIEAMIRNELQDFRFGDDERITLSGSDASIPQDLAQLLALALHELVTNALKFGALSTDAGRLRISWETRGDRLCIRWQESGVPVIAPANLHQGFGREFLEDALPYQLGAVTSFDLGRDGLMCSIDVPLRPKLPLGRIGAAGF